MSDVAIAADFGSSLGRAIYSANCGQTKPELLLLDSEVVEVPRESIENYEKYRVGSARPEDSSWVQVGESYLAVGFLARRQFNTVHCRNCLKIDSAIPQTLAMLGAVAQKRELGNAFSISLGIVLPWSEYRDRDKFRGVLAEVLGDFTYRGQEFHITLEHFTALPEGGGLFARGRAPRPRQMLAPAAEVNVAVLMVGYRNASLLVMERGQLTRGLTSDLGFSQVVTRVQDCTSGQGEGALVQAICCGRKLDERVLGRLARSNRADLRAMEISELRQAISHGVCEYLVLLNNWLSQQLPRRLNLDEILIGGGTARYLKPELTETLKSYGAQLNWGQTLERRVRQAFGLEVKHDSLATRLADVYGLFYKLLEKPLPKLKEGKDAA